MPMFFSFPRVRRLSLFDRWKHLDQTARGLILVRALRSVAQGALTVDFVLYLKELHWSAPHIGLLLMSSGLVGASLSLVVGVASDRRGRKRFLIWYEVLLILGTLAALISRSMLILIPVAVIFAFGRGANGNAGPFGPAEQSWLARAVPPKERGATFSLNATAGFWGMALGSWLAAVLPDWSIPLWGPGPNRYQSLFVLTLLIALVNLAQIACIPDRTVDANPIPSDATNKPEAVVRHDENRALAWLVGVNAINSLGVGFIAPLFPYWFSVRYGVGPGAIGTLYGLTFVLTGASSLITGWLTTLYGVPRVIVGVRIVGVGLLLLLPFMPSFPWASLLYLLRSLVNRGTFGARQAFSVSLVRDQRRGLASSLNAISWNIPAAVGPALGGWLLGTGSLTAPFLLAALLQLGYIGAFQKFLVPLASDH